jgi:GntR family transcriptional regulator/MocR family aminotransferase
MRRAYAERHDRILRTLTTEFTRWVVPVPSVTGIHLAASLRSRSMRLERDLAQRALAEGVAFDRLSVYCTSDRPQAGVVLGYGAIPTSKIDEGLRRLHECFVATYSRCD